MGVKNYNIFIKDILLAWNPALINYLSVYKLPFLIISSIYFNHVYRAPIYCNNLAFLSTILKESFCFHWRISKTLQRFFYFFWTVFLLLSWSNYIIVYLLQPTWVTHKGWDFNYTGSRSTFEFPIRVNLSGPSLCFTARTLG